MRTDKLRLLAAGTVLAAVAVTLPIPPVASPPPAPVPAPGTQVPGPDPTPPPGTDPDEPPTEDCPLDLAALGVAPEALLGIETEVACREHLLVLGPLRVDELPLLGPILGG